MAIDSDLEGSLEMSNYKYKSYYIQYIFLCLICLIIVGLIIRSNYLDESEKGNTSEIIILVVASLFVAYRIYDYFF